MTQLGAGVKVGPYVVERMLREGRGGFGQVVLARPQEGAGSERVALKIARVALGGEPDSREELNDLYARSLMAEVEALRGLNHPGIVRLYPIPAVHIKRTFVARALELDGQPWYFAMEYLAGPSAVKLVGQRGALAPGLAVEIGQQTAAALEYIHGRGLAHLDVSANNILLREPLAEAAGASSDEIHLQAVLVDFGAAQRLVRRAEVEEGRLVYLPPERVRVLQGAPPETMTDKPAADIYSLGVALYFMLAGREPFRGSRAQVTEAILSEEPAPASTQNHELRAYPELDDLILHMLEKQPGDRPTIRQVIEGLEESLPSPRLVRAAGARRLLPRLGRSEATWRSVAFGLMLLSLAELGGLGYLAMDRPASPTSSPVVTAGKATRALATAPKALAPVGDFVGPAPGDSAPRDTGPLAPDSAGGGPALAPDGSAAAPAIGASDATPAPASAGTPERATPVPTLQPSVTPYPTRTSVKR
jgi:serine/threonine protein kinase